MHIFPIRSRWRSVLAWIVAAGLVFGGTLVWAIVTDLTNVRNVHQPAATHASQGELNALPPDER